MELSPRMRAKLDAARDAQQRAEDAARSEERPVGQVYEEQEYIRRRQLLERLPTILSDAAALGRVAVGRGVAPTMHLVQTRWVMNWRRFGSRKPKSTLLLSGWGLADAGAVTTNPHDEVVAAAGHDTYSPDIQQRTVTTPVFRKVMLGVNTRLYIADYISPSAYSGGILIAADHSSLAFGNPSPLDLRTVYGVSTSADAIEQGLVEFAQANRLYA